MRRGISLIGGLAIVAALPAAPALAMPDGIRTGNDLLEFCTGQYSTAGEGLCYGFIAGLLSRDRLAGAITPGTRIVCLPAEVSNGQMRDVVIAYLKNHPEKRHYDAGQLAIAALRDAFGSNQQACAGRP